jgi:hypothetical protein
MVAVQDLHGCHGAYKSPSGLQHARNLPHYCAVIGNALQHVEGRDQIETAGREREPCGIRARDWPARLVSD